MFYIYADGKLIYQPLDRQLVVFSPHLSLEMGKAGTLEFSIPPTNKYYGELRQLRTIVTVEMDEVEIFRGRVLSIERNFNNMKKIYCEGDLAYLVDSVQRGERFNGKAHALFRKIVAAHNASVEAEKRFEVGEIGIENRDVILSGQDEGEEDPDVGLIDYEQIAINSVADEWLTSYDYIQTCLIDYCGGYLRTRKVGDTVYLDLLKDYGNTAAQEIEFGVNLLDLTEEFAAEDIFTVLIPLGDENLTIASVNRGSAELIDEEAVAQYGRILKTHVFSSVSDPNTLLENARRFLANHDNFPRTITVKAVDLHLLDSTVKELRLGDSVHVRSAPHALLNYLTCTRIEYDLENAANNTYTFGDPRQTLTQRYRKDAQAAREQAKKESTKKSAKTGKKAGKKAEEEIKKESDRFFDAWINVDPSAAHINMGAIYRELKDTKKTLENEVGIDLDGVKANINIKTLKTQYDEQEKEIAQQSARIELYHTDTEAKIELTTANHKKLEDLEQGHYAELTLRSSLLESEIKLKADKVTVEAIDVNLSALTKTVSGVQDQVDEAKVTISAVSEEVGQNRQRISKNEASITTLSDSMNSSISLLANSLSGVSQRTASLEVRADNAESSITLKADKTTVNSKVIELNGKISSLSADVADVKSLVATKVTADEVDSRISTSLSTRSLDILAGRIRCVYIGAGEMVIGGKSVATQAWVTEQITNAVAKCASASHSHSWSSITGKPSTFTPASHSHSFSGSTTFNIGHVHYVYNTKANSGGMSSNYSKTISISGRTGTN